MLAGVITRHRNKTYSWVDRVERDKKTDDDFKNGTGTVYDI